MRTFRFNLLNERNTEAIINATRRNVYMWHSGIPAGVSGFNMMETPLIPVILILRFIMLLLFGCVL